MIKEWAGHLGLLKQLRQGGSLVLCEWWWLVVAGMYQRVDKAEAEEAAKAAETT